MNKRSGIHYCEYINIGEFTVPFKDNAITALQRPDYLPIIKNSEKYYGGSQMWFLTDHRYSRDYVLHNYGCKTIAIADLFLYLALQNKTLQTPITALALKKQNEINYIDYISYVHTIYRTYAKNKPPMSISGPSIARSVTSYSKAYGLGLKAFWQWKLSYYDMLDRIEEMLGKDIPVILSIGPNTPKLWGRKGIPFYELKEIDYREPGSDAGKPREEVSKPYYYNPVKQNVNRHYITVTALIKDEVTGRIMLRISSRGRQYYINYEEYRDYIETWGGTFTSSLVLIKKEYY